MTELIKYRRMIEKSLCFGLVFIISPCFFIFEMSIVRPIIARTYKFGIFKYGFHTICPTFCFINMFGNMLMGILTDTSIITSRNGGSYCEICKIQRPEQSWHCKTCNTCILRRDHHCFYFSRCIGIKNLRFYVLYLGHLFISMIYCLYYNYYYVVIKFENDLYLSAFRIINPLIRYLIPQPMEIKDLYVFFLILNFCLVVWPGALFWFHMRNVLYGVTARESKVRRNVNWKIMKRNFVKVFGVKWYLAIICPFIESPLPID